MFLLIRKDITKWFFDLLKYIGLFFFYLFLSSIILYIVFFIFNQDIENSLDVLDLNFFVIFQVPVLIGTILLGKAMNKSLSLEDFRMEQIIQGLIIGFFLICLFIISQVLLGTTNFSWNGFSLELAVYLALFILVAVNEEILFRHLLFGHLCAKLNNKHATIVCSLIFSLIHAGNDNFNLVGFVTIFLFGVLMSVFYIRYNNLSVPIATHFTWNFFQGPVFGYPVSGLQVKSLLSAEIAGHNFYINGGNFGAEGSLLLVFIIAIYIYFISMGKGFVDIRFSKK